ncbi:hypothetical protein QFC20_003241 [Naganishia adeliensis]|uniref:Uncharacterized protein n=1 Tax=Naganishia adeliensis TaxID=92952 RepID=A0ACC2WDI0_9TREE|nr:hypothetical protein QFC20_003241 [Naganishia adeliensis]
MEGHGEWLKRKVVKNRKKAIEALSNRVLLEEQIHQLIAMMEQARPLLAWRSAAFASPGTGLRKRPGWMCTRIKDTAADYSERRNGDTSYRTRHIESSPSILNPWNGRRKTTYQDADPFHPCGCEARL